jgi:hypothetical protein
LCLILTAMLSACAGGAASDGLFNNDANADRALASHGRAWSANVGDPAGEKEIRAVFARHGGECGPPSNAPTFACAVDVPPRYPSLFTRRVMWSMTFVRETKGRARIQRTDVDHLGLDL